VIQSLIEASSTVRLSGINMKRLNIMGRYL
jgi:hypothetical protein